MLGHTALRGANIWIETNEPTVVKIKYWQKDDTKNSYVVSAKTYKETYNMHTFKLDNLEPGLSYDYQIIVDG